MKNCLKFVVQMTDARTEDNCVQNGELHMPGNYSTSRIVVWVDSYPSGFQRGRIRLEVDYILNGIPSMNF